MPINTEKISQNLRFLKGLEDNINKICFTNQEQQIQDITDTALIELSTIKNAQYTAIYFKTTFLYHSKYYTQKTTYIDTPPDEIVNNLDSILILTNQLLASKIKLKNTIRELFNTIQNPYLTILHLPDLILDKLKVDKYSYGYSKYNKDIDEKLKEGIAKVIQPILVKELLLT